MKYRLVLRLFFLWCATALLCGAVYASPGAFEDAAVEEAVVADEAYLPQPPSCESSGFFQQQRQVKGLPLPLVSEGRFYHHCEQGIIWQTDQPVHETLVLHRNGKTYQLQEGKSSELSGRFGRVLSAILNGMMSGDNAMLTRLFYIEQQMENEWHLQPKKRSLRRGLDHINLVLPQRSTGGLPSGGVKVAMVDTSLRETVISLHYTPGEKFESIVPIDCSNDKKQSEACRFLRSIVAPE